jgi:hypothetical protein
VREQGAWKPVRKKEPEERRSIQKNKLERGWRTLEFGLR